MTSPPDVLLRADASADIGTGHVVRCRTLGEELRRRGWSVALATRNLPDGLGDSIRSSGISIVDLPPLMSIADEPAFLGERFKSGVALVVVDHYGIGADWHREASRWATRIMAIDDLATEPHRVDLLLNQNLGAREERYRGLVAATTRVLCGPRFALVRPEFGAARRVGRTRSGAIDRLVIFMSGADRTDVTRRAAGAAAAAAIPADVVVGAAYPSLAALRPWIDHQPLLRLHVNVPSLAPLMQEADLAIGAPGSASWERCTLGLPALLVTLADNQLEAARLLAESGAVVSLGWHDAVSTADLEMALLDLRASPDRVRAMGRAAARIADGLGTGRVAGEIERIVGAPVVVSRGERQ
jgi:UDP-2,4-diacetamido-2,4,6-trideoxy-beta-L-altropyranose hydrolase